MAPLPPVNRLGDIGGLHRFAYDHGQYIENSNLLVGSCFPPRRGVCPAVEGGTRAASPSFSKWRLKTRSGPHRLKVELSSHHP